MHRSFFFILALVVFLPVSRAPADTQAASNYRLTLDAIDPGEYGRRQLPLSIFP